MTPDVNVLVAAARREHAHHAVALAWPDDARTRAGPERPVVILPMVGAGFLRVARLPQPFVDPMPPAVALAFLTTLLQSPHVTMPTLGGEWPTFVALFERHVPPPKDVTDLWIAATVTHCGEHLVTLDRGFRRFLPADALTVLDPAAP